MVARGPLVPIRSPRVWLVVGEKLGDNQQVELIGETLARRLAWPIETRRLRFRPSEGRQWKFRPDVTHVEWSRSDALLAPWPDVIVTIGRLPSMVALWIKQQSGGATKLVIIGRPRRWLYRFDLIIAAAHHHVPDMRNVIRPGLPLITVDRAAIAAARAMWMPRFAKMRRPLFAMFAGGQAKPHIFDDAVATDLMSLARRCVEDAGGSLWVSTSPRTSPTVVDALSRAMPPGGQLFRWRPDSADNPYFGLLACADRFIVTGDSVSMQVAVVRLGKPLAIFPLPAKYDLTERFRRAAASIAYGKRSHLPILPRLIRRAQALGLVKFPRDVDSVHDLLFERGLAVRLGEPFLPPATEVDVDLDRIVRRIRDLAIGVGKSSAPILSGRTA